MKHAENLLRLNEVDSFVREGLLEEESCLGVAAAPSYGKPWIAFARQKFTRSGFDERSNHLE